MPRKLPEPPKMCGVRVADFMSAPNSTLPKPTMLDCPAKIKILSLPLPSVIAVLGVTEVVVGVGVGVGVAGLLLDEVGFAALGSDAPPQDTRKLATNRKLERWAMLRTRCSERVKCIDVFRKAGGLDLKTNALSR